MHRRSMVGPRPRDRQLVTPAPTRARPREAAPSALRRPLRVKRVEPTVGRKALPAHEKLFAAPVEPHHHAHIQKWLVELSEGRDLRILAKVEDLLVPTG